MTWSGPERNPALPAGRYWFIFDEPQFPLFAQWRKRFPGVKVVATEYSKGPPASEFVVFTVPPDVLTVWEFKGFPNRAADSVTSKSDVVQAPVIDTPDLGDALGAVKSIGVAVGWGLGLLALAQLLRAFRR